MTLFEVHTAENIKNTVFWDTIMCCLAGKYKCSGQKCPLDDGFYKMLIFIYQPTPCHILVDCNLNKAFAEYFHLPFNGRIFITDSMHITVVMCESDPK
jgi:hypothetical protein